jgi:hypothetical protein
MDPDSYTNDKRKQTKTSKRIPNLRDVFPTLRIRCSFRLNNETHRFLLDYGYYILLYLGPIFLSLFFIFR